MGRPKGIRMPVGMKRVRINTTVSPETWERMRRAQRDGESLGMVIDRWSRRAKKQGEHAPQE